MYAMDTSHCVPWEPEEGHIAQRKRPEARSSGNENAVEVPAEPLVSSPVIVGMQAEGWAARALR
jgi:hypothetical protein